jgi:RimJ/RimL family protein N-acetyltransferase
MSREKAEDTESLLVKDRFTTEHLGRQVYRLVNIDRAAEALTAIPPDTTSVMIEAKVPVDRVEDAGRLTGLGFSLVDTSIQLDVDTGRIAVNVAGPDRRWTIRAACSEDRASIERVAAENLTTSRFHLDPRIDRRAASDLKKAWAGNFFEGRRGDRLLVVDTGGTIGGFLLTVERGDQGVIDLVALEPSVRGTGAFGALVGEWVKQAAGLKRLVVGTQISNLRSIRAYARAGFSVCGASYVLHYHA